MAPSPRDRCQRQAYMLYQRLVETSNRSPVVVRQDYRLTDAEVTCCELTASEAEVFGIDPRLLHALAWGYTRYMDMIGVSDATFGEHRVEERNTYPEFFKGEAVYSMDAAVGFMTTACRLPPAQAVLWVCRAAVQFVRSGLIVGESMTTPPWAFGTVKAPDQDGEQGQGDDSLPF